MKAILLILWTAACSWAAEACLQIDAARVLASDVAKAVPAFASIPPETVIGYSPASGLTRWWRGEQLRAIALRQSVDPGPLADLCVQRPVRAVTRDEVVAALRGALPDGAELELVDYCRLPVPRGALVFQQPGLSGSAIAGADTPLMWKGRVVFEEKRSVSFWATVKVRVRQEGLFAVQVIPQGKVIEPGDVQRESRIGPIFAPKPVSDLAALAGLEARRSILAGAPVLPSDLEQPRAVVPGEMVKLQIRSGMAQVGTVAKAVTGGRIGDAILVVNQQSSKRFQARVQAKGVVTVDLENQNENVQDSGRDAGSSARTGNRAVPAAGRSARERREAAAAQSAGSRHPGS
ncbi:MAG: flagellar basal body P-ring formation protein FlgA [Acidobacteria bacterium]|nr:flagellar basal body P-ring formation protein FlgA [Acidobacteriota bacterium]